MTVLDTYAHIGFTYLERGTENVVNVVRAVLSSPPPMHVTESRAPLDLAEIYSDKPLPGGRHPKKVLLFAPRTDPKSTVLFANRADGWQTLAVCISKRVGGPVYRFALSTDEHEWPMTLFEVWEGGVHRRHVSVIKDVDRWKFWQTGEPLPEEDVVVYRKRRIRDRLSREYIISLAERLGFAIADNRFWQSDSKAVYFEEQRAAQEEVSRNPPS